MSKEKRIWHYIYTCSTKLLVVAGGLLAVQTPEERMFHQQSDLFSGLGVQL